MKKTLAALTLGTLTLAAEPGSSQAVLKHREHNGIGYDTGYTTLEVFLAPKWKNGFMPFVDLRGHAFNDGKFATNAGIGLRYNWTDFTVGGNFYYDFRDASNLQPHQLAGGLEFLWEHMDVRLNGYGPIDDTKFEKTPRFVKFSGNSAIFKRRLKAALPMIDGEIGAPFGWRCGDWSMYGALGSYYLFKKTVNGVELGKAWGGQGRVELNIIDRYKMTALATYDEIFKWTVQGAVSVNLPFRKRGETKNRLCLARNQLPYRQEIIPIQSKNRQAVPPFNLIFVNNTSSSNGTAESPYPTLALAQANSNPGDVIYVFRGDGTTTGMSDGITLQNNQRFHGSGAPMDLGGFIVPALTASGPNIRNTAGNAVTLANANTVVGFNVVSATGDGIQKPGGFSGNYFIAHNSIDSVTIGIDFLSSINSQAIIAQNSVSNASAGGIIVLPSSTATVLAVVQSNNVRAIAGNPSIQFRSTSDSRLGGLIANNQATNNNQAIGIYCQAPNNSMQNAIVKGNTVAVNTTDFERASLRFDSFQTGKLTFQASGNTLSLSNPVFITSAEDTSTLSGVLENNRFFNPPNGNAVRVTPHDTTMSSYTFRRNFMDGSTSQPTFFYQTQTSAVVSNVTASNNVILNTSNRAVEIENPIGIVTMDLSGNRIISSNTNTVSNSSAGLLVIDILNNVIKTTHAISLSFTTTDATTLTCANIAGNTATGSLSLDATAPAELQVESSTASVEGVAQDNTFPGGITTTGNVTFVNPGTCP